MKIVKLKKELWKEQQAARKAELIELGAQLRELKPKTKEAMRDLQRLLNAYNVNSLNNRGTSKNEIRYQESSLIYNRYIKALHHQWQTQGKALQLRKEYRCKHIIYSLYKGTPMENIESIPDDAHDRACYQCRYHTDTYHYKSEIEQAIRDQKDFAETRKNWLNLRQIAV